MKNQPQNKTLYQEIATLIEQSKHDLAIQVNSALTLVFWKIGARINQEILQNQRADYGKEVVKSIAKELALNFGASFSDKNLRRMMQFSTVFPDFEIVVSLTRQLKSTKTKTMKPE